MENAGTSSDQTYPPSQMSRSEKVFAAILNHWREYAVPPVIRDVMQETGITSTSVVGYYYQKLTKIGRIVMVKHHPVPIEILKLIKGDFAQ